MTTSKTYSLCRSCNQIKRNKSGAHWSVFICDDCARAKQGTAVKSVAPLLSPVLLWGSLRPLLSLEKAATAYVWLAWLVLAGVCLVNLWLGVVLVRALR